MRTTRCLDCKIAGIIMPHVAAASARRIVDTVRYALPSDRQDILIIAMLESATAVANIDDIDDIDDILAVEGVDVFFLARVNLSVPASWLSR